MIYRTASGMNNTTLSDWFSGETLIFDLGDVPLAKTGARREDNFKPYLSPEQLIVGHTYLVNTGETAGYGNVPDSRFWTLRRVCSRLIGSM